MIARFAELVDMLPRPLDFVRYIKLKLGLVILAAGLAGVAVYWSILGEVPPRTSTTAIVVALATSQVLAHGMTRPLREMTAAARAMARGDYTRRVRASSRDEVGQLAAAFNQMASDLAALATGSVALGRLSADAVPALDRLPAKQRSCALADIAGALESTRDGWWGWNASRQRARAIIAAGPRPTTADCW